MQVKIVENLIAAGDAARAERVLNACVHCGFCTATCPTYLLEGNELDSPRGRIYLMKEMLETGSASAVTRTHLDRCLTCRSCETTCPSGVEYHKLLTVGRDTVERLAPRPGTQRIVRSALSNLMLSPRLLGFLFAAGRLVAPLLPSALRRTYFPPQRSSTAGTYRKISRKFPESDATGGAVVLVRGCVQPMLRPDIDGALQRILEHFGVPVSLSAAANCCGAASYHTSGEEQARELARRQIDYWWQLAETTPLRAIVSTASGCGVHLRDYPLLLADDPEYRDKAAELAQLVRDPVELLDGLLAQRPLDLAAPDKKAKVVFHCPCTLQHGLGLSGRVEQLLHSLGVEVPAVRDSHLCCGSAGTYSVLQPERAKSLRGKKLQSLQESNPDLLLTANIGCLLHLQGGTETPVRHWLEYVADFLPHAS
ncbi:glycolate oxidase subunit GlcF [Microbulbifer hainanensis]|uniref:glycolate oxidase subunit GlcF n=1 Tax=Microbulbifer hainanensis TaxID=2735675 RepID=UPI001867871C|nr:glycolate oxidase subunit GlcF [Microbulbifer hainanensis]